MMHTFNHMTPGRSSIWHVFPTTPNSGYFRWPWIWNERKSVQNSNLVNRKSAFFVWFEPLNQKREANKILLRLLILAKTQPKKKSEKCGNLPSAFCHENSRESKPNDPDTAKMWILKNFNLKSQWKERM